MATLKAQDDAFQRHFSTVYPQYREPEKTVIQPVKSAPKPVKQAIAEEKPPEPVVRDVMNIASLEKTHFPYRFILQRVADVSGLTVAEICSPRRTKILVHWRQITMELMRRYTMASMPVIGKQLGGRDHTTVLHGLRRVESRMHLFAADLAKVEKLL